MRTTFVISGDRLVSEIRPRDEPLAFKVGDVLVLGGPYNTPFGVVPAGIKGRVKHVDELDGTMWLFMEGRDPALIYWDNLLVLVPYDTEDLTELIRLTVDNKLPEEHEMVPQQGTSE